MNFYKKIEILLNEKQWAYYSDMDKYKSLETIIKNPRDFIKKYLERGDKLPPKLNNALNNLSIGRCYHTISIFFFGLILYYESNVLKEYIDRYIEETKKQSEYTLDSIGFEYYWFLICFYHDLLSEYEDNNVDKDIVRLFSLDRRENPEDFILKSLVTIIKDTNAIPKVLLDNCYEYIKYRKHKMGIKFDHGITAGIAFHHFRKKAFEEIESKALHNEDKIKIENSEYKVYHDEKKGLTWTKDLVDTTHKEIACLIIGHNIWFKKIDDPEVDNYKNEFMLSDLVISQPVFSFIEHPMYFLLTFVDTLDIFKIYITECGENYKLNDKALNKDYCMEHMLEYCKQTIIQIHDDSISIAIKEQHMDDLFEKIFEKLEKNKYWLPIDVKKEIQLFIKFTSKG